MDLSDDYCKADELRNMFKLKNIIFELKIKLESLKTTFLNIIQ